MNCNCLLTSLWDHGFWNKPYISNQEIFSTWPNREDKNINFLRTKTFFNHFKGLSLKQIKLIFLKVTPTLKIFDIFSWRKNSLTRKIRLISKLITYVTTWLINNFNTYSAQYRTNWKQPDNEIWSVNRK